MNGKHMKMFLSKFDQNRTKNEERSKMTFLKAGEGKGREEGNPQF